MTDHREGSFFGRRKGKPLRERQTALMQTLLPRLKVDIAAPPPADLKSLFAADVAAVWLEVGFGGGEHFLHEAARLPDIGFIGVEPFVSGMAKAVAALDEAPLANARLFDDDAGKLLDWLPASSVDGVYQLYPDPWPKKRHWKRRFINPVNLDRYHRVMKPGAIFRFASDIDTYVDWTLRHMRDHPGFEWLAESAADWKTPWQPWSGTRYEEKAVGEGRVPRYLEFRRI
ncbi:tRNA (guanosine(46)-N7)-methyltransferase TrmB [Stappia sp. F7233]|uniref:tRNA (guanine-N(7)-)-methyltransferase n=1 Tax=Stappia albiluteola TaxID=2758565 RepID=A0A839AAL9_9HYPH|nr:tRNA (guanine(46)-N(7))-methyltransferase TrmB [Stappia albiluteola]MBA5776088.1 tRNA (guanosine(46)-N7)-methyltransferase TrmB [Stappia albiluteola]